MLLLRPKKLDDSLWLDDATAGAQSERAGMPLVLSAALAVRSVHRGRAIFGLDRRKTPGRPVYNFRASWLVQGVI